MIGRILALEILSQELDVESRLATIFSSGHLQIIENAVKGANIAGTLTVDAVRKIVDAEIDQMHKKAGVDYVVIIPLSFNLSGISSMKNQVLKLKAQGYEITFGSLEELIPKGTIEQLGTNPLGAESPLRSSIAAFSIGVKTRDAYFASVRAWTPANIAASMLELCLSGGIGVKFPSMPFGYVRLQNCAIVCKGGALEEALGQLELVEDTPSGLTMSFENKWNDLKDLEKRLQDIESKATQPIKSAAYKSIELYGAAANELDPNFALLKLWIALELLVGLGQTTNVRAAANRLITVFRHKPAVWDMEVKRLLDKRNKIVHQGQLEATITDVHFARLLFAFTFGLLLKYGTEYSEEKALQALLDLGNKDSSAIQQVEKAVHSLATS
jgi:hypothetical protein